jgi:hypothetical protein
VVFGGPRWQERAVTNVDPERNIVVLEAVEGGVVRKLLGHGPTRDDRCVEVILSSILKASRVAPEAVTRLYSEWEPTASDAVYIARTLPTAQVTYSFSRPADGDWQVAMLRVRAVIAEEAQRPHGPPSGSRVELPIPSESKRWWQFWK